MASTASGLRDADRDRRKTCLLERHVLEDGFDDRGPRCVDALVTDVRADARRGRSPTSSARQPAAFDRALVVAADRGKPAIERLRRRVGQRGRSMPAFAQAIAMPPPIVPAPTIGDALDRRGRDVAAADPAASRHARSAKKTWISALACSERTHSTKELALPAAALVERQTVAAASIASIALSGAVCCARILAASARAAAKSGAFASGVPRRSCASRVFDGAAARRGSTARTPPPPPMRSSVDRVASMRPPRARRAAVIGCAGDAHVERLLDADQPRQPLRAFRAGDDAEIDFRLAELRLGDAPRDSARPSRARARRRAPCRGWPSRPACAQSSMRCRRS